MKGSGAQRASTTLSRSAGGRILSAWQSAPPQVLWLIDPDRLPVEAYPAAAEAYMAAGGQWALVGGSLLTHASLAAWCDVARRQVPLPLILFPGSPTQLASAVDALLFLFLASGRNPHYLIGAHIEAAPFLHQWGGEVIPTTYLLVGTEIRTVHYISQTLPIPMDKPELAQATALAGAYLGQQVIYIDAGSGAPTPPSTDFIYAIREVLSLPILVGGGIRTPTAAYELLRAGASFVVIGTAAEKAVFSRSAWEEYFSLRI